MTTRTITLEMTQIEANMCLESMITERLRIRGFINERWARGENIGPEAAANLDALNYLVNTLKAKTGRW